MNKNDQIARRRTFAIISHPDAGKTTITEKLLLFGGAIQMAGAIRARRSDRHAASDFLKVEQERGISVSTAVMSFEYLDHAINLLWLGVRQSKFFFLIWLMRSRCFLVNIRLSNFASII